MAWTAEHRRAADRRWLRYPSDLTDAKWGLVAPMIRPAKHGGRPRRVDVREVLNPRRRPGDGSTAADTRRVCSAAAGQRVAEVLP